MGIGGLLQGGGIGVLTRAYGLTCDRLVGATVVTGGDSKISTAADVEPELFRALRGGGGGNVGVVTEFVVRTEPAPDLTILRLGFPAGSAAAVLGAWQGWAPSGPDQLWSTCLISSGSPPTVLVTGCLVGTPSDAAPLLDQLVHAAGVAPLDRFVAAFGYLDAMRYFACCSRKTVAVCRPVSEGGDLRRAAFRASSRILGRPLDSDGVAQVVALVTGAPGLDLLVDALGGAAGRMLPMRRRSRTAALWPACRSIRTGSATIGCMPLIRHSLRSSATAPTSTISTLPSRTGARLLRRQPSSAPCRGGAVRPGPAARLRAERPARLTPMTTGWPC